MNPYEKAERRLYPTWRERFQRHYSGGKVQWFSGWREKWDVLSFMLLVSTALLGWPYVWASSVVASSLRARRLDREAWVAKPVIPGSRGRQRGVGWLGRGAVMGTIGFVLPMGLLLLGVGIPGQVRGLVAGAIPLVAVFVPRLTRQEGRRRGQTRNDSQGAPAGGSPGPVASSDQRRKRLGAVTAAFLAGSSVGTVGVAVVAALDWDDMGFATWTVVSLFVAANVAQVVVVGLMTHGLDEAERTVSIAARNHAKDLLREKKQRRRSD